jgi:Recombinase/Resolvase, N terminal domain
MSAEILPEGLLKRKAVVYVRQPTQTQVQTNLESQRRQYDLVEVARRYGFANIELIDMTWAARPVATSLDRVSTSWSPPCVPERSARAVPGRFAPRSQWPDWPHLLELCGLVGARVIDADGIYDPHRPNDRLLLGMKGSISEFELGVIRARMHDAKRGKALRGDLRISAPIGYIWHREIGLGLDPNLRVQEAVRIVFARLRQLVSARQVLLSLTAEQMHFPRPSDGRTLVNFDWTPIRYRNIISILKNPFYAGAYAYGKSEKRTTLVDPRTRTTYKHR